MLATLSGTMLAPGVSKNGRLYTPDAIAKAVTRMQARLADENARPIVMRTHHDAGDDTTQIVGHLTAVNLDDAGAARYEAVLNGTQAARDVLAATGDEDARSLRNVSIYGWWVGQPRTVRHEGKPVETADDIEIAAVDFTAFPGVEGARIDTVTPAAGGKPRESATGRHVITESVEAALSIVDETGPARRRVRRLPPRPTPTEFGATVTNETVVHPAKLLGETELGECYDCAYEDRAGFSISANNGPINVNISAWHGIDPAELEVIAKAAMAAACDALKALDPDMDADIDVDGAPNADTDGSMESSDDAMETALPATGVTPRDLAKYLARKKNTAETTQTPAPTEAGPTVKESAVTDAQKPAETAATTTETDEKPLTAAALAEAFAPVVDALKALAPQTPAAAPAAAATTETAPPAATTENAPAENAATESTPKVDIKAEATKAVQDALREAIPQILESVGLPQRKGLRVTETADQVPPEQMWEQRSTVWNTVLPGGTPAAPTPPAGA